MYMPNYYPFRDLIWVERRLEMKGFVPSGTKYQYLIYEFYPYLVPKGTANQKLSTP